MKVCGLLNQSVWFYQTRGAPSDKGRLTTLRDSSAAENREPQLQNKRGISYCKKICFGGN